METISLTGARKPSLFLVGAMKAATSSAAAALGSSEDAFIPRIKEPNHFCTDLHVHPHAILRYTTHSMAGFHFISSRRRYLRLFADAPVECSCLIDASTSYLYSEMAPKKIAEFDPSAKIVVLLRNPALRAWSEYIMNRAIGIEGNSFHEAVAREREMLKKGQSFLFKRYVKAGLYARQVSMYFDQFPRENIHIDVVDRPGHTFETVMDRMYAFCGVKPPSHRPFISHRDNVGKLARNETVNAALYNTGAKAFLSKILPVTLKERAKQAYYSTDIPRMERSDFERMEEIFSASNSELERLTGIDLAHWGSFDTDG